MAETAIAIYTADEWAERLVRLYPMNWTSDEAKIAGGLLYGLFQTAGTQLNFLEENLDWVLAATRLSKARDTALDSFAKDYFGKVQGIDFSLDRAIGEPDDNYRLRIAEALLQPGGTRPDVDRVVFNLTNVHPRIIEPWSILDTCGADGASFVDIDTPENPCRVAEIERHHTGFVESPLPPYGSNGQNPVYGVDYGIGVDRGFVIDPEPTWFMGEKALDSALQRVRMANTIIYRNYGVSIAANYVRGGTKALTEGSYNCPIYLSPPASNALVVLASSGWNATASARVTDNANFSIDMSAEAPGLNYCDWIAAPATVPGFGILPIAPDQDTADLALPLPGGFVFVTPSWNSNAWLTALPGSIMHYEFSAPGIPGACLYYGTFLNPNIGRIDLDGTTDTIPVNLNYPALDGYQLMILPSWNTRWYVTKTNTTFTISFTEFPPAGSFFCWGVLAQPL